VRFLLPSDVPPHRQGVPDSSGKIGLQPLFPGDRTFTTDTTKLTATIVVTTRLIHWPVVLSGIELCLVEPEPEVVIPLLKLLFTSGDKASLEPRKGDSNLSTVNDESFN
jgi:hypothetical protein